MRVREAIWRKTFLEGLRECANVRMACERAGIERTTAYKARERDAVFAAQWEQIVQDAVDSLEKEAWRRAREGVTRIEPIMYQGKQVGEKVITEYSDNLITFLLKANRPEKYREQIKFITQPEAEKVVDDAIQKHNLPAGTTVVDSTM